MKRNIKRGTGKKSKIPFYERRTAVPIYTSEEATERYLEEIHEWIAEKENPPEDDDLKDDYLEFPENNIGDIILILDHKKFFYSETIYHVTQDVYYTGNSKFLRGTPAKVKGYRDNDTIDDHPPWRNIDLKLLCLDNEKSFREVYVDPDDANSAFVFLPHPSKIQQFKKLLPSFTKNPKKLEKILMEYYKVEKEYHKIEKSRRKFISLFNNLKKHPK